MVKTKKNAFYIKICFRTHEICSREHRNPFNFNNSFGRFDELPAGVFDERKTSRHAKP